MARPLRHLRELSLRVPNQTPSYSALEIAVVGSTAVAALYVAKAVFIPLAIAVLLTFVLAPLVRYLRKISIARGIAVFLVVTFAFSVIFGSGAIIAQQIADLAQDLPRFQINLKEKIKSFSGAAGSGGALGRASDTLQELQNDLGKANAAKTAQPPSLTLPAEGDTAKAVPVIVRDRDATPFDQLQTIIGVAIAPLATAGLVLLFVVFMLLQREDMRDRAIRLLGAHDLEKSTTAIDDAARRLSKYFLTLTLLNATFGAVIAVGLWMLEVPSPLLWGILAMLMRFVPFVGSFIAAAFPVVLAAAVDPGWSTLFGVLALYLIAEPIMGHVIEPVVQGHTTGLSPLAIIISAAFWTALWGPVGLLLAVPLTVVLVVLGRHVDRLKFLEILLGDTPPLSAAERFYQRMLAADPAESIEQAERILKQADLITYYDQVVIEGLRLAQADADRRVLEPQRLIEVARSVDVVTESLDTYDIASPVPILASSEPGGPAGAPALDERITTEDGIVLPQAHRALPTPDDIQPSWRTGSAILCVGGQSALDKAAADVLAQVLNKSALAARSVVATDLPTIHEEVGDIRAVFVSAFDSRHKAAQSRLLIRRLRRRCPKAVFIGVFWTLDRAASADDALATTMGVDLLALSLGEALELAARLATAAPQGGPALASPSVDLADDQATPKVA